MSLRDALLTSRFVPAAIFELYRLGRYPKRVGPLYVDLWRTRRKAAFLRQMTAPASNGKTVFIPSLSTRLMQIKAEAMLAIALKRRGWHPVVFLASRKDPIPRRYFEVFGITDFVYYDDFPLSAEDKATTQAEADRIAGGTVTTQTVKNLRFGKAWLGPQIISTISRETYQGAPDITNPAVLARVVEMLPEMIERCLIAERVMEAVKPDLILTNEPNYAFYGPIIDIAIANNVEVIHFTMPWRDDAFNFKRLVPSTRRFHPSSVAQNSFERVRQLDWTPAMDQTVDEVFQVRSYGGHRMMSINQNGVRPFAREEICRELNLDPAKKIAVVFSHILWDANLFYGDDLFENMGEWLVETVKAAAANPAVNWVIKLHPANIFKLQRDDCVTKEINDLQLIRDHVGDLPPHVFILAPDSPISSLSFYQGADYIITVRGTVSAEAPCFGVPLLTAGTGRADHLGFTVDSESREEYLDRLAHIQDIPRLSDEQVRLARQHAYAAFCCRPWVLRSFRVDLRSLTDASDVLGWNMHLVAKSEDEIDRFGDLPAFAEWVENPDQIDYLNLDVAR